jgi:xanthine/CO dehydrogenase XdhC/CoxF family maturation factor
VKELVDILRLWAQRRAEPLALATLVRARGSSYRRPGARMLICSDGTTVGSLSGGCLEDEVVASARDVIRTGTPALMNFDTRLRFGCNGSIDVFVERARDEFFQKLNDAFAQRGSCTAITRFAGDHPQLGSRIARRHVCAAADAFVQRIEPPIQLLVFGDGPDSIPLRAFAEILGWRVVEMEHAADLPVTTDARTAAIVKSHNYGRDFAALRHLLAMDLHYVGLMGPRKRRDQLLHALLDEGVQLEAELFAPAGLDLNAETPEEIALAIIAEIQAVLAAGSGESLRDRKAPIHGWNVARPAATAMPPVECETSAR